MPPQHRPRRRITSRARALAVTLVTGMLACLALAPATASAAPGLLMGIEQNGGMADPTMRTEQLDEFKGLGAGLTRYVLRFDRVATCNPYNTGVPATSPVNPCYDFSVPDAVVRGASERNIQVLLTIYGAPVWSLGGTFRYTGTSEAQFNHFSQQFADFTEATTRRYSGKNGIPRVGRWTLWNEPNGGYFWEPRFINGRMVVAERYARLYDAAARRLKAVDPTMQVALGPTAPTPPDLKPVDFVKVMLPAIQKLGSPVDAYAHNAYMGVWSPLAPRTKAPAVGLGNVRDLTRELDKYPVTAGKKLWITEFGYMTAPANQVAVTPERQAELLADSAYYSWSHKRISIFVWYGLVDDGTTTDHSGFQTGLFYARDRCGQRRCPKPSAEVFRHTLWLSNRAPVHGSGISIFGQGRSNPALTKVFASTGGVWKPYANKTTKRTGTVLLRKFKITADTWFVVCDSACGPMLKVSPVASTIRTNRLPTSSMGLRTALRGGVKVRMGCTTCRLKSWGVLEAAAGGLKKRAVVARGTAKVSGAGQDIVLRFNAAAKARLAGSSRVRVLIRTRVTDQNGAVATWDRTLILKR